MLDGEASAEEAAAADAHLARCDICRAVIERDARITRLVRGLSLEPGPPVDGVLLTVLPGGGLPSESMGRRVRRWATQATCLTVEVILSISEHAREALAPRLGVQRWGGALHAEALRGTASTVNYLPLHVIGVAACGCAPTCGCGCQAGRACRCRTLAA